MKVLNSKKLDQIIANRVRAARIDADWADTTDFIVRRHNKSGEDVREFEARAKREGKNIWVTYAIIGTDKFGNPDYDTYRFLEETEEQVLKRAENLPQD